MLGIQWNIRETGKATGEKRSGHCGSRIVVAELCWGLCDVWLCKVPYLQVNVCVSYVLVGLDMQTLL